jgi:hypothetical protein
MEGLSVWVVATAWIGLALFHPLAVLDSGRLLIFGRPLDRSLCRKRVDPVGPFRRRRGNALAAEELAKPLHAGSLRRMRAGLLTARRRVLPGSSNPRNGSPQNRVGLASRRRHKGRTGAHLRRDAPARQSAPMCPQLEGHKRPAKRKVRRAGWPSVAARALPQFSQRGPPLRASPSRYR